MRAGPAAGWQRVTAKGGQVHSATGTGSTILAGDAICLVADMWCRHALNGLFCAGRVVRPLRNAVERVRAAARAAAALEEGDVDERHHVGRRLTRMLALAPLQIRLVNRSPSGCRDVLHPRGH